MLDGYGVYMYCLITIVAWPEGFMHANTRNSIFCEGRGGGNGPPIPPLDPPLLVAQLNALLQELACSTIWWTDNDPSPTVWVGFCYYTCTCSFLWRLRTIRGQRTIRESKHTVKNDSSDLGWFMELANFISLFQSQKTECMRARVFLSFIISKEERATSQESELPV